MDCSNVRDIRDALKKLPTGDHAYDLSYEHAMTRIKGQGPYQQRLAEQVLCWISYAIRPLSTTALQEAVATRVGDSNLDKEGISTIEQIVSVCVGLVVIDGKSDVIRLVHYTTQQYFERAKTTWFPQAETDLTRVCVAYLSFDVFQTGSCETSSDFEDRLRLHPFYKYAALNWRHHCRRASTVIQEVLDFLQSGRKMDATIKALQIYDRFHGFPEYSHSSPRKWTTMHSLAFFGFEKLAGELLQGTVDVNAMDWYDRTPLSIAVDRGHDRVVNLLLETGQVDVNLENNDGETPLWLAARLGHDGVVKLLCATGQAVTREQA